MVLVSDFRLQHLDSLSKSIDHCTLIDDLIVKETQSDIHELPDLCLDPLVLLALNLNPSIALLLIRLEHFNRASNIDFAHTTKLKTDLRFVHIILFRLQKHIALHNGAIKPVHLESGHHRLLDWLAGLRDHVGSKRKFLVRKCTRLLQRGELGLFGGFYCQMR